MAWYPEEKRTVMPWTPILDGQLFSWDRFPIDGMGLTKIRLIFCSVVTAGTGAGVITTGIYNWLKGITLRNDKDEYYFRNVPGLALVRLGNYLDKAMPYYDPIIAAAAGETYIAVLDLPLVYPFLNRPEDTIVETKRLNKLTLEISTGGPIDFFGVPGTATAVTTMAIETIGTRASIGVDKDGKPDPVRAQAFFHSHVRTYPMIHSDQRQFFELEAAPDLALLGFLLFNHGVSGIPWLGTTAAFAGLDHLTDVSFYDASHRYLNRIQLNSFQMERNQCPAFNDFNRHAADVTSPETRIGEYPHSFVKIGGSINEALATKLIPKLEFVNDIANATDEIDLMIWGVRALRG
jgi:hypothetical protein